MSDNAAARRAILEAAPTGALAIELTDDQVGDLKVLEAATKPVPQSHATRKAGESFTAYGNRLKSGDRRLQRAEDAKKKSGKKTRDGKDAAFESLHPRGRGGSWVLKAGSSGEDVKAAQKKIGGTKADGRFGPKTEAAVRRYQKAHGLQVDGQIGAQTVASLRGKKGVKPGKATESDRKWLNGPSKTKAR